jgi:hypothetical protein
MISSGTIHLPFEGLPGMPGGWPLNTVGPAVQGERTWLSPDIPFSPGGPFSQPPNVVVSLAGVDATNTSGPLRVRVDVENVQTEEFNIRVTVMDDTLLTYLLVTWVAHDTA